ncbi:MAG: biotin/lipoyl-binding protein, partial [Alphaproteobacteria bacterium]|nr:biotin/lipoyl-binding protein [Alphaproteobacteria bacterium]
MAAFSTDKSLRRFQLMGYVSIAVIIGAVGSWSVLTKLNGAVIAPATVVAETNTKRIQHKDGGIVREILVKDGDRVTEGQDLVVLDDTETRAELGIIDALLVEAMAKKARLEAQRDDAKSVIYPDELEKRRGDPDVATVLAGQDKLFAARKAAVEGKINQLNEQIGQVSEQVQGLTAQIGSKERQIKLITDELT